MRSLLSVATIGALLACQPRTPDGQPELKSPRPSVIGAKEGERRFLRGGTAPLLIKVDPVTTGPGATVFIPQGTCIALANTGNDTVSMFAVFSSPGFERVLREVSSPPGAPPKPLTPENRAAAFHRGHAEAGPAKC